MAGKEATALSTAEICRRCRDETARYHRNEPHDDRFCFDMIRRAIVERDDVCWQGLHAIYGPQVSAWCRRTAPNASTDVDELSAIAWGKFFASYTATKLSAASDSAAVLRYLKMCAQSAAIDAVRAQNTPASLDAEAFEPPDPAPTPAEEQEEHAAHEELWGIVDRVLRNQPERVLLHLRYEIGLRPAEIQAQRPDLFPSIGDVYRLTRNIQERLARSEALRAWREEQRE